MNIEALHRLHANKVTLTEEIAQITAKIKPAEAEHIRLEREANTARKQPKSQSDTPDVPAHIVEALDASAKALTPLFKALESAEAKLAALEKETNSVGLEAIDKLYPEALQTSREIARFDEMEATLTTERAALQRNCDPDDEVSLKKLEAVSLRLSVIPFKRESLQENQEGQWVEMEPFYRAARGELGSRVRSMQEGVTQRFCEMVRPLFSVEEWHLARVEAESLVRRSANYQALQIIEANAPGAWSSDFKLESVPLLLAAFKALDAIKKA